MHRILTPTTAFIIASTLCGIAQAQSAHGEPTNVESVGTTAAQGAPVGAHAPRTMGDDPAEYDSSVEGGAGLGETGVPPRNDSKPTVDSDDHTGAKRP